MIKSILIPTDGSQNSMTALDYGVHFSKIFGAELTGLNVIDIRALEGPFLNDISGSLGFSPYQNFLPKFQEMFEKKADVILESFSAVCKDNSVPFKSKKLSGVISGVITEEAKKTDLVIIAQRGEHEKWSTGLLGSTTESVVRRSPRPVLVTPNAFRKTEKILVAYDGSVQSNKALKTALDMFIPFNLEISVVYVAKNEENSKLILNEVTEFIAPYNIQAEIKWIKGEGPQHILDFAYEKNLDMIVMGAFGRSWIHELILGGTTAYIIRKSSIPVLLSR